MKQLKYYLLLIIFISNFAFSQENATLESDDAAASETEGYQLYWNDESEEVVEYSIPEPVPEPEAVQRVFDRPIMAEITSGPVFTRSSDGNTYKTPEFFISGNVYYMIYRYLCVGGGFQYQTSGFISKPSMKAVELGIVNEGDRLTISLDLFKIPIRVIGLYPLAFLSRYESLYWLSLFTPYICTGFEISFPLSAIYRGIDGVDYEIKDDLKKAFVSYIFGAGIEFRINVKERDYGSLCIDYQINSTLGQVINNANYQDLSISTARMTEHYLRISYRFWFFR